MNEEINLNYLPKDRINRGCSKCHLKTMPAHCQACTTWEKDGSF